MPSSAADHAPSARRTVAGASLALIAAETVTRATSFLAIAYLSRTLAPAGMGAVEFGTALFGLVLVLGTGGVEAVFTPAAAREPAAVPSLAGRSVLLSALLFAFVGTGLAASAWCAEVAPDLRMSAPLFAGAALFAPFAMRFAFVAGERAAVLGATNVLGALVFLGLCLITVRTPDDVTRVGGAWLAAAGLRAGVAFAAFRRFFGSVVVPRDATAAWLGRVARVGLGSLAASLVLNADVVVLGLRRSPEEVAAYGLATKVPLFLSSLAGLVYTALFPTLVRAVASRDVARQRRLAERALALGLGAGVPGAVAIGFTAEPFAVLLFGDQFRAAAPLLAVLAWRVPLAAASGIFQSLVWAANPEREAALTVTVALATLVPLPFVASHAGPAGVAACMLLGLAFGLALFVRAAAIPGVALARPLGWSVAGAAISAGLLVALGPRNGPAGVAQMLAAWTVGSAVALLALRPRSRQP